METTLRELFQAPWGILQARRGEVESGPYGAHDRIMEEEISSQFLPVESVAGDMGCHEATARKWMREHGGRYIVRAGRYCYYRPDVIRIAALRKAGAS